MWSTKNYLVLVAKLWGHLSHQIIDFSIKHHAFKLLLVLVSWTLGSYLLLGFGAWGWVFYSYLFFSDCFSYGVSAKGFLEGEGDKF